MDKQEHGPTLFYTFINNEYHQNTTWSEYFETFGRFNTRP